MLGHFVEDFMEQSVDVLPLIVGIALLSCRRQFFPQECQNGVILLHQRGAGEELSFGGNRAICWGGLSGESDGGRWGGEGTIWVKIRRIFTPFVAYNLAVNLFFHGFEHKN